MLKTTWFLVADGARAQIYSRELPCEHITPLHAHAFAAPTRNRSSAAGTDRPGIGRDRMGFGRHAMAPEVDWQTHEKMMFAKHLSRTLKSGADHRFFDDLVLVAPPWMLGQLRDALDAGMRRRIVAEIPKDLTHLPARELEARLSGMGEG